MQLLLFHCPRSRPCRPGLGQSRPPLRGLFSGALAIALGASAVVLGALGCGSGVGPQGSGGTGESGFKAASTQEWVQQFGLSTIPATPGNVAQNLLMGVAVDGQDNAIIGADSDGAYPGYSDPGLGGENVIIKFDPTGKQLWLREIGSGSEALQGVATDAQSNIAVVSTTIGAFPGYSNPSGAPEGVVFKLDPNGKQLWLRQTTEASLAVPQSIATDPQGNVVVGSQWYSFATGTSYFQGFYLTKLDGSTGKTLWAHQYASGSTVNSIAVDQAGNIIVAGLGTLPPPPVYSPRQSFVAKIDGSTGGVIWVQPFASYSATAAVNFWSAAVDPQGDVIAGGAIDASANPAFADGYGSFSSTQGLVAKLDGSTGGIVWANQFATGKGEQVFGVAADSNGNVLAVGVTSGVFAPPFTQPQDINFAVKFDPNGQKVWVQQFGNGPLFSVTVTGYPQAAVDSRGNLYFGGETEGAFAGFSNPNNSVEMFLAKFGP